MDMAASRGTLVHSPLLPCRADRDHGSFTYSPSFIPSNRAALGVFEGPGLALGPYLGGGCRRRPRCRAWTSCDLGSFGLLAHGSSCAGVLLPCRFLLLFALAKVVLGRGVSVLVAGRCVVFRHASSVVVGWNCERPRGLRGHLPDSTMESTPGRPATLVWRLSDDTLLCGPAGSTVIAFKDTDSQGETGR
jgi:hypothetical protein